MIPRRRRTVLVAGGALLAAATLLGGGSRPLLAGSLSVSPTRVDLAPDQRAAVVTLQNNGAEGVLVQVQTFAWARSAASSDLDPTRELVAVPPVAELAPGQKQLIRVALRGPPARADVETAYRLLITEVPPELPGGRSGVRLALRLSLPVFVAPPGAAPAPAWSLEPGGRRLVLANRGSAHLHVRRVRVFAGGGRGGGGEPVQVIEEPAYVLAGQRQAWSLAPAAAGATGPLALKADTDIGELEAQVVVAAPAGG